MTITSLVRGLLLCPLFLIALSVSSYAQTNHFVYTNNNAAGPNSVSGWSVGAGGALTPVAGSPFATGGNGAGTGFYATVGVQALLVGNYLYATNDGDSVNGHTTVAGFAINTTTGALTAVPGSPFETDGSQPAFGTSLAATPDGLFLYANNPVDASITVYSIDQMTGALTKVSTFLLGTTGPISIRMSADGNFLFAALYYDDAVAVMSVNPMTGTLAHVTGSPFVLTTPMGGSFAGPVALEVNCAGDLLFVADAASTTTTTVSVLGIDAMTGALTEVAGSPFQIGTGGNSNTLTLSTDDRFLYVGNQNTNTVTALAVGAGGTLSAVPGSPFANAAGTFAPETMAVDRAGRFLYVANQTATGTPAAGSVTVYLINTLTGALSLHPSTPTSTGVTSFLPTVAAFPSKTCTPCGFEDTFDGTAGTVPAGWSAVTGSPWELDGMGAFVNPSGLASLNATAANDEVVTSGDEVYTVSLTRTGTANGSPYGIIIRGDATAAANGRWNNGYAFVITRTSRWFIYKWTPSTVTTLANGFAPAKIVNNDPMTTTQATNTLRVVASGGTFTFFVNNLTMALATVSDGMHTSGQVGVFIRREGPSVDDDLRVNSAILTCSTGSMIGAKAEASAARSGAPAEPLGAVERSERPTTRLTRRRR